MRPEIEVKASNGAVSEDMRNEYKNMCLTNLEDRSKYVYQYGLKCSSFALNLLNS